MTISRSSILLLCRRPGYTPCSEHTRACLSGRQLPSPGQRYLLFHQFSIAALPIEMEYVLYLRAVQCLHSPLRMLTNWSLAALVPFIFLLGPRIGNGKRAPLPPDSGIAMRRKSTLPINPFAAICLVQTHRRSLACLYLKRRSSAPGTLLQKCPQVMYRVVTGMPIPDLCVIIHRYNGRHAVLINSESIHVRIPEKKSSLHCSHIFR